MTLTLLRDRYAVDRWSAAFALFSSTIPFAR
jgi:hypothetical protein